MKNRVYKYFFHEFIRYFAVVLFAATSVIWTIQAVNFLDLVTDDGHAFRIYLLYSLLTLPKILTKLIPFSFLIASIITILKLEKDNELIILWTSGLNKIHFVNLIFRISLIIMLVQLILSSLINPQTLNKSRALLKNSELQFVPSLLKEKKFNDTVEGLTIFVEKKNIDGTYSNIFIRDDGNVLTQVSEGSSTIFAKKGYIFEKDKKLVLEKGNLQKLDKSGSISIITFQKTQLNFSGISTKSITEPKIQETSTLQLLSCMKDEITDTHNCERQGKEKKNIIIEINKRFGMPIYIPLIALICCFLISSRKDKKFYSWRKYISFVIGFLILVTSEIIVRYSGNSLNHTAAYFFIPLSLLPLVYIFLIKSFKYENIK